MERPVDSELETTEDDSEVSQDSMVDYSTGDSFPEDREDVDGNVGQQIELDGEMVEVEELDDEVVAPEEYEDDEKEFLADNLFWGNLTKSQSESLRDMAMEPLVDTPIRAPVLVGNGVKTVSKPTHAPVSARPQAAAAAYDEGNVASAASASSVYLRRGPIASSSVQKRRIHPVYVSAGVANPDPTPPLTSSLGAPLQGSGGSTAYPGSMGHRDPPSLPLAKSSSTRKNPTSRKSEFPDKLMPALIRYINGKSRSKADIIVHMLDLAKKKEIKVTKQSIKRKLDDRDFVTTSTHPAYRFDIWNVDQRYLHLASRAPNSLLAAPLPGSERHAISSVLAASANRHDRPNSPAGAYLSGQKRRSSPTPVGTISDHYGAKRNPSAVSRDGNAGTYTGSRPPNSLFSNRRLATGAGHSAASSSQPGQIPVHPLNKLLLGDMSSADIFSAANAVPPRPRPSGLKPGFTGTRTSDQKRIKPVPVSAVDGADTMRHRSNESLPPVATNEDLMDDVESLGSTIDPHSDSDMYDGAPDTDMNDSQYDKSSSLPSIPGFGGSVEHGHESDSLPPMPGFVRRGHESDSLPSELGEPVASRSPVKEYEYTALDLGRGYGPASADNSTEDDDFTHDSSDMNDRHVSYPDSDVIVIDDDDDDDDDDEDGEIPNHEEFSGELDDIAGAIKQRGGPYIRTEMPIVAAAITGLADATGVSGINDVAAAHAHRSRSHKSGKRLDHDQFYGELKDLHMNAFNRSEKHKAVEMPIVKKMMADFIEMVSF